jgi:hypothetical protein
MHFADSDPLILFMHLTKCNVNFSMKFGAFILCGQPHSTPTRAAARLNYSVRVD